MHTLIDVKNNIPNFIMLTPGNVHDTLAMDSLPVEAGAYYLMDKSYVAFAKNVVHESLTNDFTLEAITIAELYRERWTIETFFKWIKQHLHIKTFYGTSQNAVFTQIWIAICDYLLLIIALKMYYIEQNLYIFSNVIGQVLFERTPLNELFDKPIINQNPEDDRQISLW